MSHHKKYRNDIAYKICSFLKLILPTIRNYENVMIHILGITKRVGELFLARKKTSHALKYSKSAIALL